MNNYNKHKHKKSYFISLLFYNKILTTTPDPSVHPQRRGKMLMRKAVSDIKDYK